MESSIYLVLVRLVYLYSSVKRPRIKVQTMTVVRLHINPIATVGIASIYSIVSLLPNHYSRLSTYNSQRNHNIIPTKMTRRMRQSRNNSQQECQDRQTVCHKDSYYGGIAPVAHRIVALGCGDVFCCWV